MAWYEIIESPVGPVFLGGSDEGLHRVDFVAEGHEDARLVALLEAAAGEPAQRDPAAAAPAVEAFTAYFAGERSTFELPLAARGTPFQQQVWRTLLEIPPGETASYGEVARAAGYPGAARAAGGAIGRNPLGVIVPCHRVIGASGAITGYGGGLDRKRWLLAHEAAMATTVTP